jgi:hypothetical protein
MNLEANITAWRERMRAAGIQSPVPLEELEGHLREEIEEQVKAGVKEQEAFHAATGEIGQGAELKTEFLKVGGFSGWFGEEPRIRTNRILGALWTALGLWSFFNLIRIFAFDPQAWPGKHYLLYGTSPQSQYVAIVVAGILLFQGSTWGRKAIRMLAGFLILEICGLLIKTGCQRDLYLSGIFFYVMLWNLPVVVFSLATIWWLRSPQTLKANHV